VTSQYWNKGRETDLYNRTGVPQAKIWNKQREADLYNPPRAILRPYSKELGSTPPTPPATPTAELKPLEPKAEQIKPKEITGGDVAQWSGKKAAGAMDYIAGGIKKGTEGIRRGMEDNPAGIAAAGIGAGLGALGLSKMLRRRREVPA
jgi:hypothetical protein